VGVSTKRGKRVFRGGLAREKKGEMGSVEGMVIKPSTMMSTQKLEGKNSGTRVVECGREGGTFKEKKVKRQT